MTQSAVSRSPGLNSWITAAKAPGCLFPLQNLPYGIFSTRDNPTLRAGTALGDKIIDLAALDAAGLLAAIPSAPGGFREETLNGFIALGPDAWRALRARLTALFRADNPEVRDAAALHDRVLVPLREATMHMPIAVAGYTDFYSSKEHATNVGSMFRDPKNALLPNWLEIPIGYNGRASSVVVSGTPVRRPNGQLKAPDAARPLMGPSRKLDIELEMAFIVGRGNALGQPIPIDQAESHIFGMVLLNDWSARDIQQWEYVPLGPFNSKSFATSISPWIVTMDALEPFRVPGPVQSPAPLAYLQHTGDHAFDIALEVALQPALAAHATIISRSNFSTMYWSMAQQLAHHTSGGCNARVGDLMASGTISGATPGSLGSLLELTWNGKNPLGVEGGERTFLEDGDTVSITGWCQGEDYRVGFGEVSGTILPAHLL
jgi:fumarylacetoacetase